MKTIDFGLSFGSCHLAHRVLTLFSGRRVRTLRGNSSKNRWLVAMVAAAAAP